MTAPLPPAATCDCGARLHAEAAWNGDDWVWLDEDGRSLVDLAPEEYRRDPKAWWDNLARSDIATYSALSARHALGMLGWTHHHRPATVDPFPDPVPESCGMPMRLTPRGWRCRVHAGGCQVTRQEPE